MNHHFMLTVAGLEGVVTLANFPCNNTTPGWTPGHWYDQWAHVCWSDGTRWHTRALDRVPAGEARTYARSDLPAEIPTEAMPSLFLHPERRDGGADLVQGTHMQSAPNWRGTIGLKGPTTSVAYQGEYPSAMTHIPAGTLLSIGPMGQRGDGVSTKFILVNLRANPACDETPIRFLRLADGAVLKTATARYNRCTVVSMDDIDCDDDQLVAVTAARITGLPIYFSHDPDFRFLSLEHTHPPVELVSFGDRIGVQQHMKKHFIGLAEQGAS